MVLPGLLGDSPAVGTWSPAYFSTNYGHVDVQITSGRESSVDYERHYRDTIQTVTMKELTERLESSDESNDFYLVARNNFFENPQLRGLRDHLHPPDDIIDNSDRRPGAAKAWIGPRGTVTPLHYDEHSILFTQVYGRKQFKLIPSFDYGYLYARDAYYSEVDPENWDPVRHPLFARGLGHGCRGRTRRRAVHPGGLVALGALTVGVDLCDLLELRVAVDQHPVRPRLSSRCFARAAQRERLSRTTSAASSNSEESGCRLSGVIASTRTVLCPAWIRTAS